MIPISTKEQWAALKAGDKVQVINHAEYVGMIGEVVNIYHGDDEELYVRIFSLELGRRLSLFHWRFAIEENLPPEAKVVKKMLALEQRFNSRKKQ